MKRGMFKRKKKMMEGYKLSRNTLMNYKSL